MVAILIAGAALLGLQAHFDKATITAVPFTFEAKMSPHSPLIGTQKTLFVVEWPHVVAIDAGSGKRLWETNLTSYAAIHWKYKPLGTFPVEFGGSVAFCFTYSKPDGTIETEIESRNRKDGALNFIVHVETSPIALRIVYSPGTKTLELEEKERTFDYMNRPNVAAVGNLLLVVPDPYLNPELFVLSSATGAVKAKILPDGVTPNSVTEPLSNLKPISFGPCVYARGELISLADSPYGSPTTLVFLGDRILAEYRDDNYYRVLRLKEHLGVALFPWTPNQHGKIEDIWHGAFMRVGYPKDNLPTYGPCFGQLGGNPVILRRQFAAPTCSIVEIDEGGNIIRTAPIDTYGIWDMTVGDSGVFLVSGDLSKDLFDVNGIKLLSLTTQHMAIGDTLYWHTTLMPDGVAWTMYSSVGNFDNFKFVGAVATIRKKKSVK